MTTFRSFLSSLLLALSAGSAQAWTIRAEATYQFGDVTDMVKAQSREIDYRVFYLCARQSWVDNGVVKSVPSIATGQHQRVRVRIGGTEVTMDGVNRGQGKIEIGGEIRGYGEDGRVR